MTGPALVEINARQIADLARALGSRRLGELLLVLQQRIDGLPDRQGPSTAVLTAMRRDLHRWRGSAISLGLVSVALDIEAAERILAALPGDAAESNGGGPAPAALDAAVQQVRCDLQASIEQLAAQLPGLMPDHVPDA